MAKLDFTKIARHRRVYIDMDYGNKLSPSELEWVTNFYEAYYNCSGEMVDEVGDVCEWQTTGFCRGAASQLIKGRSALNRGHWSRRMDVLNHCVSIESQGFVEPVKGLIRGAV